MPRADESHSPALDVTPETSLDLLRRAQAGDGDALNSLIARYLPRMRRWAAGRLPVSARGMTDTHDLVQDSIFRAVRRIDQLEIRGEGALQAYVRQTLLNQIRQEIRRASRRPRCDHGNVEDIAAGIADPAPSPVDQAIGREALERYEEALTRLRPSDREAIVARIELGCSYQEVAEGLGKPSANAARMAVERALLRLVEYMNENGSR
jgi:RNA polymerase sigma-70 factor (ECF subfamily)